MAENATNPVPPAEPLPPLPLSPIDCQYSPTIGRIALALSQAQGEFQMPVKNCEAKVQGQTASGKSYDYTFRYADLGAILDAVRGPLAKHEIAFLQPTRYSEFGTYLDTLLIHSSGEWIRWSIAISLEGKTQEIGGRLTYFKRYMASAIGIAADEDDDANHASGNQAQITRAEPQQRSTPLARGPQRDPKTGTAKGGPVEEEATPSKTDLLETCGKMIKGASGKRIGVLFNEFLAAEKAPKLSDLNTTQLVKMIESTNETLDREAKSDVPY